MFKCCAVARPIAVLPAISTPASMIRNRKWSLQRCVRGLKMGTWLSVSGSRTASRACLDPLQLRHDRTRLSRSRRPPRARGTRCSTSNGLLKNSSGARQYSHWWFARRATSSYSLGGTPMFAGSVDSANDLLALNAPAPEAFRQASNKGALAQPTTIVEQLGAAGTEIVPQSCDG